MIKHYFTFYCALLQLVAAAPALTKVGIHKESTRKALVKYMARALRAEQDPENLAR